MNLLMLYDNIINYVLFFEVYRLEFKVMAIIFLNKNFNFA